MLNICPAFAHLYQIVKLKPPVPFTSKDIDQNDGKILRSPFFRNFAMEMCVYCVQWPTLILNFKGQQL